MTEGADRRADAKRREEMIAGARRAEAEEAQKIIDDFVAEARRRGLAPEPLRAITYSGTSLKTDQTGWYLNRRKSLAVGADGGYYRLVVPDAGALARLRGIKLAPEPPPLNVAANGKDGEGGELTWFLGRVLRGERD